VLPGESANPNSNHFPDGTGLPPRPAYSAEIVCQQVDRFIEIIGDNQWCPVGPTHLQTPRYSKADSS
jgi:hypothetical protein